MRMRSMLPTFCLEVIVDRADVTEVRLCGTLSRELISRPNYDRTEHRCLDGRGRRCSLFKKLFCFLSSLFLSLPISFQFCILINFILLSIPTIKLLFFISLISHPLQHYVIFMPKLLLSSLSAGREPGFNELLRRPQKCLLSRLCQVPTLWSGKFSGQWCTNNQTYLIFVIFYTGKIFGEKNLQ